jgi:hypothetical protein
MVKRIYMTQYSKYSEIILSTTENRKSVAYGFETGSLRKLAPKHLFFSLFSIINIFYYIVTFLLTIY